MGSAAPRDGVPHAVQQSNSVLHSIADRLRLPPHQNHFPFAATPRGPPPRRGVRENVVTMAGGAVLRDRPVPPSSLYCVEAMAAAAPLEWTSTGGWLESVGRLADWKQSRLSFGLRALKAQPPQPGRPTDPVFFPYIPSPMGKLSGHGPKCGQSRLVGQSAGLKVDLCESKQPTKFCSPVACLGRAGEEEPINSQPASPSPIGCNSPLIRAMGPRQHKQQPAGGCLYAAFCTIRCTALSSLAMTHPRIRFSEIFITVSLNVDSKF